MRRSVFLLRSAAAPLPVDGSVLLGTFTEPCSCLFAAAPPARHFKPDSKLTAHVCLASTSGSPHVVAVASAALVLSIRFYANAHF